MPSCLGIQIENDVIKYAKVRKEKDSIKVESFNVMFYEDLKSTVRQIITETNSQKSPIAVNLSGEMYNYFQVASILGKQDMKKAVELEFDLLCEERNYKKNTLETRMLYAPSTENNEKTEAIAISGTQADIAHKKSNFAEYKIAAMHPLSTSITNLIEPNDKSNIAIINIEEETKLTIMSGGQVVLVDVIEEGMRDILNKIAIIENSKRKAYEVCKNTTLYSQDSEENGQEGNEHLDSIMPTLYAIVTKVKEKIEDINLNISKIYITGLATSINNIDLYFQEYFEKARCEILRPFFANVTSIKTSIKDYIEVNSAIALALDGLGYGYRELNFVTNATSNKKVFKTPNTGAINKEGMGFSKKFDAVEKMVTRISILFGIMILLYVISTNIIVDQINEKSEEVNKSIAKADIEIQKASADLNKIDKQTDIYKTKIEELNSLEVNMEKDRIVPRCAIPNLLHGLIDITPRKVQIISIQNQSGTDHIVIEAQSEDYEQLGYLKAAITTNNILYNVKSTSGTKSETKVTTIIEGDLPCEKYY